MKSLSHSKMFLELIPAALHAMDQPTMDGVNTHFVSQKTREAGVKVALSGLGGDEVFAGYSSFRTYRAWSDSRKHGGSYARHCSQIAREGIFHAITPTAIRPKSWCLIDTRQWPFDSSILSFEDVIYAGTVR